ncbi:MAG: GNAT family N-acetyltransferase [Acaryochloris sp. RU_4_1]|nr:GNAT family N-acetyltransferase [Acaryochloris sp. RU_4_1]NJR55714.1 GNAT family N-acetyltransferase [Acaryochloris sp. CRU_2_0]
MQPVPPALPLPYLLRSAKVSDKWILQNMIWQFTWEVGIALDLRLFGYAIFRIGLVLLALGLQLQVRPLIRMVDVQFILVMTSVATVGLGIYLTSRVMGQLVMRLFGVLLSWSQFQVLERDGVILGCALLNSYTAHCELAYVFVAPPYRHQGLGSRIVQTLVQQSTQDIYLACKPEVVAFYEQQGFLVQTWPELPTSVKRCFQLFRPHPRLWGFPLYFMRKATMGSASLSLEAANLAESP